MLLDVSARDVADTLDVIQRDSVGLVSRMLDVAATTKLVDVSNVIDPALVNVSDPVKGAAEKYGCVLDKDP
jgi:hypothetical protein